MSSFLIIIVLSILAAIIWQFIKKDPDNKNKSNSPTDPTDRDDSSYFDDWDEPL